MSPACVACVRTNVTKVSPDFGCLSLSHRNDCRHADVRNFATSLIAVVHFQATKRKRLSA